MSNWYLDNAEKLHAANPRSFFIPSAEERDNLEPGDFIRLVFALHEKREDGMTGERMWIEVQGRDGDEYYGALTNQPVEVDLDLGDTIRFKAEHVIAIEVEGESEYEDKLAIAPKRLIRDDDLEPLVVHHHPEDEKRPPNADGERPSGWDLMVGDQPQEEVDKEELLTPSLPWLMERYPAFGELVRSGARDGTWVLQDGRYVKEAQITSATDS